MSCCTSGQGHVFARRPDGYATGTDAVVCARPPSLHVGRDLAQRRTERGPSGPHPYRERPVRTAGAGGAVRDAGAGAHVRGGGLAGGASSCGSRRGGGPPRGSGRGVSARSPERRLGRQGAQAGRLLGRADSRTAAPRGGGRTGHSPRRHARAAAAAAAPAPRRPPPGPRAPGPAPRHGRVRHGGARPARRARLPPLLQ